MLLPYTENERKVFWCPADDARYPVEGLSYEYLPRVWAKAHIDALLAAMNRDGEREDYINEILRLSEKYKIITPYTAFLAAPRSLLRPRLIEPGDPVIRVKTDPSVTNIVAVLSFGETHQARLHGRPSNSPGVTLPVLATVDAPARGRSVTRNRGGVTRRRYDRT